MNPGIQVPRGWFQAYAIWWKPSVLQISLSHGPFRLFLSFLLAQLDINTRLATGTTHTRCQTLLQVFMAARNILPCPHQAPHEKGMKGWDWGSNIVVASALLINWKAHQRTFWRLINIWEHHSSYFFDRQLHLCEDKIKDKSFISEIDSFICKDEIITVITLLSTWSVTSGVTDI